MDSFLWDLIHLEIPRQQQFYSIFTQPPGETFGCYKDGFLVLYKIFSI